MPHHHTEQRNSNNTFDGSGDGKTSRRYVSRRNGLNPEKKGIPCGLIISPVLLVTGRVLSRPGASGWPTPARPMVAWIRFTCRSQPLLSSSALRRRCRPRETLRLRLRRFLGDGDRLGRLQSRLGLCSRHLSRPRLRLLLRQRCRLSFGISFCKIQTRSGNPTARNSRIEMKMFKNVHTHERREMSEKKGRRVSHRGRAQGGIFLQEKYFFFGFR